LTFRDASLDELAAVEQLLGRPCAGRCCVVARRLDGRPVVIENGSNPGEISVALVVVTVSTEFVPLR